VGEEGVSKGKKRNWLCEEGGVANCRIRMIWAGAGVNEGVSAAGRATFYARERSVDSLVEGDGRLIWTKRKGEEGKGAPLRLSKGRRPTSVAIGRSSFCWSWRKKRLGGEEVKFSTFRKKERAKRCFDVRGTSLE